MHEVSIMAEAARMAVESAQANGAQRVTALRLSVGALSGADPEAMRFAWDVVSDNTIAAGSRLEIELIPAAGWCAQCEAEFTCINLFSECPHCHTLSKTLRRGRELEIVSVEIE